MPWIADPTLPMARRSLCALLLAAPLPALAQQPTQIVQWLRDPIRLRAESGSELQRLPRSAMPSLPLKIERVTPQGLIGFINPATGTMAYVITQDVRTTTGQQAQTITPLYNSAPCQTAGSNAFRNCPR